MSSIELPENVTEALKHTGLKLSDDGFSNVVKAVSKELRTREEQALPVDDGKDASLVKSAHTAVTTIFVEAAKQDVNEETLLSFLEDCSLSAKKSEDLVKTYEKIKPELRETLRKTGFALPHIVGVDWRLDYFMKSNQLEKINEPCFSVAFKTEDANNVSNTVQLACTMSQMQDLVSKLKEASKRLDVIRS